MTESDRLAERFDDLSERLEIECHRRADLKSISELDSYAMVLVDEVVLDRNREELRELEGKLKRVVLVHSLQSEAGVGDLELVLFIVPADPDANDLAARWTKLWTKLDGRSRCGLDGQ